MQESSDSNAEKGLNPEQVQSLLKYLIYIVLHKDSGSDDKKDETKQSLLDLLKTDVHLRG